MAHLVRNAFEKHAGLPLVGSFCFRLPGARRDVRRQRLRHRLWRRRRARPRRICCSRCLPRCGFLPCCCQLRLKTGGAWRTGSNAWCAYCSGGVRGPLGGGCGGGAVRHRRANDGRVVQRRGGGRSRAATAVAVGCFII